MRVLIYLTGLLLLTSCSSKLNLVTYDYPFPDTQLETQYQLSNTNSGSKKIAFIFPDNLDSVDWNENPIVKVLSKKDYRVVIPLIPGKNETEQIAFDSRTKRINAALLIFNNLLTKGLIDSSSEILLLGIGEGAFIVPALCNRMPYVERFIMVNATIGSFFNDLLLSVSEHNSNILNSSKMRYFGMDSMEELKGVIEEVLSNASNTRSMGNRTNADWLSYYSSPTDPDLSIASQKGDILISEKYPFLSQSSKRQLQILLNNNPLLDINVSNLKGKGNFNKVKDQEELASKLNSLL